MKTRVFPLLALLGAFASGAKTGETPPVLTFSPESWVEYHVTLPARRLLLPPEKKTGDEKEDEAADSLPTGGEDVDDEAEGPETGEDGNSNASTASDQTESDREGLPPPLLPLATPMTGTTRLTVLEADTESVVLQIEVGGLTRNLRIERHEFDVAQLVGGYRPPPSLPNFAEAKETLTIKGREVATIRKTWPDKDSGTTVTVWTNAEIPFHVAKLTVDGGEGGAFELVVVDYHRAQ